MSGRTPASFFGLVWRGWFAGVLVIFMPIWLVATIGVAVSGNWAELWPFLSGLLMLPMIAALQGLIAGGLVVLGLRVWPPKVTK